MNIQDNFASVFRRLYPVVAPFVIAFGWTWYHASKHDPWRFVGMTYLLWIGFYLGWQAFKLFYLYLVQHYRRHAFWQDQFVNFLDELWFCLALFFGVFFFQTELASLGYVLLVSVIVFFRTRQALKQHPASEPWLKAHAAFFVLGWFLFIVNAACQYAAYHYYILDANVKFFNIVVFRAVAMTAFWMLGFVIAFFIQGLRVWRRLSFRPTLSESHDESKGNGGISPINERDFSTPLRSARNDSKRGSILKYIPLVLWMAFFVIFIAFWVVNTGVLYYSGLYFSPAVVGHTAGAGSVAVNKVTLYLILGALAILVISLLIIRYMLRARKNAEHAFRWYETGIGLVAATLLVGVSSLSNTPEHSVIKSFYSYYAGTAENKVLNDTVAAKLEKFGLKYSTSTFYVADRPYVYSPTSTIRLLPERLTKSKPNILIIFLESFSARLTDVYNPAFTDLTPGFNEFAKDPHTTIFKKYYNASTPTITGTLSQLCSFLPPTGHEEIQNERKLQNHHLLCLPEILKTQAGFKYAAYVTAVDKEFAHKDGIFTSMGVDKIYGTSELAPYIQGAPLSWGYSDHQMFPAVWNFMHSAPQPFLMMLATVDTHPPFDLAKDAVNYGDGEQPVLNMFHTTDDAFKEFWKQFKASSFYNDTIVITVADHAIFPGALTKDIKNWPGHEDAKSAETYYDQNTFMMYIPDSVLPKEVEMYSSGLDVLPTLLQIFGINIPNSFEGHSVFDDRVKYPNLLGMHELGLYINQVNENGKRTIDYNVPTEIQCDNSQLSSRAEQSAVEGSRQLVVRDSSTTAAAAFGRNDSGDLTLCDYLQFYNWKRQMFEEGRFWKH